MPRGDTGDATLLRCSMESISDDLDVGNVWKEEDSSTISFADSQEVDEIEIEVMRGSDATSVKWKDTQETGDGPEPRSVKV